MLLVGKTQKKHPGDLLPTVPDLPPPPPKTGCHFSTVFTHLFAVCRPMYAVLRDL